MNGKLNLPCITSFIHTITPLHLTILSDIFACRDNNSNFSSQICMLAIMDIHVVTVFTETRKFPEENFTFGTDNVCENTVYSCYSFHSFNLNNYVDNKKPLESLL